jgi:hypothetical protein
MDAKEDLERIEGSEVDVSNPPEWMVQGSPKMIERASEIAARLIEDGYSEEQAYEIAVETLQDDEGIEEGTMRTIDEAELDLDDDISSSI